MNDHRAVLAFLLSEPDPDWDGSFFTLKSPADDSPEPLGLVEFDGCISARLGAPNDEVFAGHALHDRGLEAYGAQRVVNSRWLKELKVINSVHRCYRPERWQDRTHFVFWFPDSTFECVARSFKVETHRTSMRALLGHMVERLIAEARKVGTLGRALDRSSVGHWSGIAPSGPASSGFCSPGPARSWRTFTPLPLPRATSGADCRTGYGYLARMPREVRQAKARPSGDGWFVYLVRCADGSLYTGITKDVARRFKQHNNGTASKYTRSRLPVELVYHEAHPDQSSALKRESAIKAMDRREKLAMAQPRKKPTRKVREVARLEDIPNVGPAVAADLRLLGITTPAGLPGRDPYALYDELCRITGQRHDPCVLDTFIAAVRYMEGAPKTPWWKYTAERKRVLAARTEAGI